MEYLRYLYCHYNEFHKQCYWCIKKESWVKTYSEGTNENVLGIIYVLVKFERAISMITIRSRNRSIAYLVLYRKINYQLLQELFVTKKRFELVAWNIILLFSIAFLQLRMWDFFMFSVFTTHALKNHSWHHNFVKSYNHIWIKMYIWMTQTVQCTKELAMKNINF